jgi:DNA-binding MarR family transcriptional regulator
MSYPTLQEEIGKKRPFDLVEEEAFLNTIRTSQLFSDEGNLLLKKHGTSTPQYHLLRILRARGQTGIPSLAIADHMATRVPDITRLVDRLEKAGFVGRRRSQDDRRVVHVHITDAGMTLLSRIDGEVDDFLRSLLGHMSRAELDVLNRLMVKARHPDVRPARSVL